MENDPLIFFRILSTIAFCVTLAASICLYKNREKWLGADPQIPSETAGSLAYNAVQVWALMAHLLLLFATGALFF